MVEQELRPVVKEAITEDVLRAIQDLVGLTPAMVAAIKEDLLDGDTATRQKAYTLLAKYTIGHPAIVSKDDDPDQKQLVVNFALPRPGDEGDAAPETEAVELKTCDLCGQEKPANEFVDGSDRCAPCWQEQRTRVLDKYGAD